jgi:hypothetical protein
MELYKPSLDSDDVHVLSDGIHGLQELEVNKTRIINFHIFSAIICELTIRKRILLAEEQTSQSPSSGF